MTLLRSSRGLRSQSKLQPPNLERQTDRYRISQLTRNTGPQKEPISVGTLET